MVGPAQGVKKTTSYLKQSGLGVPAAGAGGQIMRRTSSVFKAPTDNFAINELASHMQSQGVGLGAIKPAGTIAALLSCTTHRDLLGSLLRKAFATDAVTASTSITIAASGQNWTLTRSTGSWITDGYNCGDVMRLLTGSFNAANILKNLIVLSIGSATVMTVAVVNGSTLVAEGPIATATCGVVGKKTSVPLTGQTNDYYTFEEWYADQSFSEVFADEKIAQAAVNLPANGNGTISYTTAGRTRTRGTVQVLTSPTVETTTPVLNGVNGIVVVNGAAVGFITGAQITINGNETHADPILGAVAVDDIQRGELMVSGNFTGKFSNQALQAIYDARTSTQLVLVCATDQTAAADFMAFNIPCLQMTDDAPDDGSKAIVRTYTFTARIPTLAFATAGNLDQSIICIQDSLA